MPKKRLIRQSSVIWADGTVDHSRVCDECGVETCSKPVHKDYYKEIVTRETYWNYLESRTHDEFWIHSHGPKKGELSKKYVKANPDVLIEKIEESVVGMKLSQEAYANLTEKQKEVWDLCMRDCLTQQRAADQLGITREVVAARLRKANARIKDFIGD